MSCFRGEIVAAFGFIKCLDTQVLKVRESTKFNKIAKRYCKLTKRKPGTIFLYHKGKRLYWKHTPQRVRTSSWALLSVRLVEL